MKEDFIIFKAKKLLRRKNNFFSGKEEFENKKYFEKKKEPPLKMQSVSEFYFSGLLQFFSS